MGERSCCYTDEEVEEMLPQVPTVTYVDIPTDERRQMHPITPPLSPTHFTTAPLDHLQREDTVTEDEEMEMLPQVVPTVTYVDIPRDEHRQMHPITPPLSVDSVVHIIQGGKRKRSNGGTKKLGVGEEKECC